MRTTTAIMGCAIAITACRTSATSDPATQSLASSTASTASAASAAPAPAASSAAPAASAASAPDNAEYGAVLSPKPAPPYEAEVRTRATAIVAALKAKDFDTVADAVHPTKGVRFSHYGEVHPTDDALLTAAQLRAAWKSGQSMKWGKRWAEDAPINEPLAKYYDEFVYNADYAAAEDITVDSVIGWGSLMYGDVAAYPGSSIVDFHVRGKHPPVYGDWNSLRVVLEKQGAKWWLVALVECQWTP
jgi:hypothetical protein